ncbi:apolipoprotein(a)-like [Branchiostoma lanceolatum]|uniref:apolipoprotein(a)-like n=1 Tax=Branchiostoma lanceolatum TaxID=7740 RepID=UPI0034533384
MRKVDVPPLTSHPAPGDGEVPAVVRPVRLSRADCRGCPGKPDGSDYRGNLSVTWTGKTCQRWDVNSPHRRHYRPEEYPELVENYCRNPGAYEPYLWCYTADPSTRWGYCSNPACPLRCTGKPDGSDYRGNLSVTWTGKTCQRWDVNFPHRHHYRPEEYPELVENYCRNPGAYEGTLWCYTEDPSTRQITSLHQNNIQPPYRQGISAEELPSDVAPRLLKNGPLQVNMKRSRVNLETAYGPDSRHGDPSISNSSGKNTDGNHHTNLSAATDVTAESGSDVSCNDAGISAFGSDDSSMRDIRHPPSALYQNQIYEPDVCSEPAHRPANSDGTPSIEPLTAVHQGGHDDDANNKLTTSTTSGAAAENDEIDYITHDVALEVDAGPSVRPKSTSRPANNDLHIKPYAARCQTDDENRGGTPYAVRHQEDDEDEIPPEIDGADGNRTHHTATDDVDITPYAVAYKRRYDMADVTRRDAPMNDADTSDSVRNDSNVQGIQHHWRTLHHQDLSVILNSLIPNPMYVPNVPQQAVRGYTGKPDGSDYRGNLSVTWSGMTCQRWDVNFPHRRRYRPEEYPELVENYCRNPGANEPYLWCYTADPSTRWGYCSNPACPLRCTGKPDGSDYRGNLSVTWSGMTCQRWDVNFPHRRNYRPEEYPELVENYCRNPGAYEGTLWCYTADPSTRPWDFCINPACPLGCTGKPDGSDYRGNLSVTRSGKTCQRWDVNFPHRRNYRPEEYPELVENYCRNPGVDEAFLWCYTTDPSTRWQYCSNPACPFLCMGKPDGSDYRGNLSVTRTGKTCQRWDVDFPHDRRYRPDEYPELVENYCRNPGVDEAFLWCYTTDPSTRWQYCNNPACPFRCTGKPDGSDYRGNLSVTRSGKTCQRWDVDFPHRRNYRPEEYPELVENYCRNPGVDEAFLWCYTTDPSTRWQYCSNLACPFQRQGVEMFKRNFRKQHVFSEKQPTWGYQEFIPWHEVCDPLKGYIKDDKIVLEAYVKAGAPRILA